MANRTEYLGCGIAVNAFVYFVLLNAACFLLLSYGRVYPFRSYCWFAEENWSRCHLVLLCSPSVIIIVVITISISMLRCSAAAKPYAMRTLCDYTLPRLRCSTLFHSSMIEKTTLEASTSILQFSELFFVSPFLFVAIWGAAGCVDCNFYWPFDVMGQRLVRIKPLIENPNAEHMRFSNNLSNYYL